MYQQIPVPPFLGIFPPGEYLVANDDGIILRISLSHAMAANDVADAIEEAGPDARRIAA